jgi:hypothetical protein
MKDERSCSRFWGLSLKIICCSWFRIKWKEGNWRDLCYISEWGNNSQVEQRILSHFTESHLIQFANFVIYSIIRYDVAHYRDHKILNWRLWHRSLSSFNPDWPMKTFLWSLLSFQSKFAFNVGQLNSQKRNHNHESPVEQSFPSKIPSITQFSWPFQTHLHYTGISMPFFLHLLLWVS